MGVDGGGGGGIDGNLVLDVAPPVAMYTWAI